MSLRTFNRADRMPARRRARRGFTLAELIIAILVLGMGLVMLAAVFPAGIAQQQFANDDVYGRIVADHALSVIRSKVGPDDFGTFEQFNLRDARPTGANGAPEAPYRRVGSSAGSEPDLFGVPGDWGWKRPGFVFDDPSTPEDEGKIDIFSWEQTYLNIGPVPLLPVYGDPATMLAVDGSLGRATEFPAGRDPTSMSESGLYPLLPAVAGVNTLYGIPYNREKYDSDFDVRTFETEMIGYDGSGNPIRRPKVPAAYILQHERTWPQSAGSRTSPAQYYWECMFRRFEGRMYVAIIVYRVASPDGEPRRYSVPRAPTGTPAGQPQGNTNLPPLPVTLRLDNPANVGGQQRNWAVVNANGAVIRPLRDIPSDASGATDTAAGSAFLPHAHYDAWQLPGQWILDKFNNVHRVVGGRRSSSDGPVRFAQPIPVAPRTPSVVGQASGPDDPDQGSPDIDQIWFIPGRDADGNTLIPVFCTVQEL